jgi:hypothetical protein
MSDELSKKIAQISELLEQSKTPDKLAGLISLISNSVTEKSSDANESTTSSSQEAPPSKSFDENIEMMMRIKKIMESVKKNNDPRADLLHSLKPFLSEKRQSSLTQCLNILKLTSLTKYIDDFDFLSKKI